MFEPSAGCSVAVTSQYPGRPSVASIQRAAASGGPKLLAVQLCAVRVEEPFAPGAGPSLPGVEQAAAIASKLHAAARPILIDIRSPFILFGPWCHGGRRSPQGKGGALGS
ncbi:hypothetical protein AEB_P2820 [Altererythrobacter sp. B11]|nr:hypothetical protein AEB_P2820 [Altererythrobacter sp. B11]